jgi:hypothetical protein
MNAFDLLLAQWTEQVKEIFPNLHCYQQQTLAFCVQGILQSGNAVMQRVAETMWEYMSCCTKMVSHERRFQRFVDNNRIEVQTCWNDFLQHVLPFWQDTPVTLALDLTPYTQEITIVYLGIMVQKRILPIAWCLMPQQEEWDQGQWEIVGRLFDQVSPLLTHSVCTLLADRGLSCLNLIKLCKQAGWHYVLRIKNEEQFRQKYRHWYQDWQQGKQVIKKEGDQWYGEVLLWQEHQFATFLSICWEPGYDQAWFLISDQRASHKRVSEYAKRMRVEACFQDQKSRGCFIECSRFTNHDHLNRWLLVVYLAMWWATHLGCSCLHHGHREEVDRKDRRDKGILRIGRLWLKALLKKVNLALALDTQERRVSVAQLAHCLPLSHRKRRLCFSICLH